jgi:hypothetical protein
MLVWRMCFNWPLSGNGSGSSRTALMAEKTALLAPMARESVATTVRLKTGVLTRVRAE